MSLFTPLLAACRRGGEREQGGGRKPPMRAAPTSSSGEPRGAPPPQNRARGQRGYLREGFVQREPAAERHDAGQLVLAGERRVEGQRAALQRDGGVRDPPGLREGRRGPSSPPAAPLTCEKPPRMMRLAGIPFFISCSMIALTGQGREIKERYMGEVLRGTPLPPPPNFLLFSAAFLIPASSSGASGVRPIRSNLGGAAGSAPNPATSTGQEGAGALPFPVPAGGWVSALQSHPSLPQTPPKAPSRPGRPPQH